MKELLISYFENQHNNILHYREVVNKTGHEESVHQLRISVKRLRAVNKLVSYLYQGSKKTKFKKINKLYKLTGRQRDVHVLIDQLKLYAETYNLEALANHLKGKEQNNKKDLTAYISQSKTIITEKQRMLFINKVKSLSQESIIINLQRYIDSNLQYVHDNLNINDIKIIHNIRKKIKTTYYLLLLFEPFGDKITASLNSENLKNIGSILGNWHDKEVLIELTKTIPKEILIKKERDKLLLQLKEERSTLLGLFRKKMN